MRVGIDATGWSSRRGFGRFTRNAVSRLVERDPATTYVLYADAAALNGAVGGRRLPAGAGTRRIEVRRAPARAAAADSRRPLGDLLRLARSVRRRDVDAFVFPSLQTYFPVLGVPTVVGVHDAIADRHPELTLPSRRARAAWRAKERLAIARARRVFTVSEPARAELAERFGLDPGRIAVVPEAPDPVFAPRPPDEAARAAREAGVPEGRSYLLYAGGISPHKNVVALLDAYAALRRERADVPMLLVAGDLDDDPFLSSAGSVRARVREARLEDDVRLPGFVPDADLAALYGGALAVALPSLAEGFGLPAVEAAACGAPVLLSDLPAHRATLGDAALYFSARDVDALRAALERVLDDAELRARMARAGREAVAGLSWDAAADALRAVIAAAAETG